MSAYSILAMKNDRTTGADILGAFIVERREAIGLTSARQLAKAAGVSASYVSNLERGYDTATGRRVNPSADKMAAIARALRIEPSQLLELAQGRRIAIRDKLTTVGIPSGRGGEVPYGYTVPVYGPVAAGESIMWTSEDSVGVTTIDGDAAGVVDAAFLIRGNSVSAYGIWDGSMVYVRRLDGEAPVSGDMVLVESEGAYYCKIYRENKLGRYLESHEEGKAPEPFPLTSEVRLIGLVVEWRQKFRRKE